MKLELPTPRPDGPVSLEAAFRSRRSIRKFSWASLTLPELSQLLWAGQGITTPRGERTAPSGGATYPLEMYAVTGKVEGLTAGIYRYEPASHSATRTVDGDRRRDLGEAALGQGCVATAPLVLVLTAMYGRITRRYGERGKRYALMEAGHVAQNILLQAAAMRLGAVPIGAFLDDRVGRILQLERGEEALYLIPVGRIA